MRSYDLALIEGAGGWRVPLNNREFLSGLPKALDIPVILVVGVKLGCINHATLTVEAILRDGLKLAGWVANHIDPEMSRSNENMSTLHSIIPAPCIGELSWLEKTNKEVVAEAMNLSQLV